MEPHVLDTVDPHLLGERIAESRRARRLTQQQVADALNLSRATIVATEKGERCPKARELVALSRLFGRPVADFVADTPLTGEPGFVAYLASELKGLDSENAAALGAAIERFERYCRWYVDLEEMLGSPLPRRYPEPYDIEGTPIERAAEEVATSERNRLGLGDGPAPNLADLLETDVGLRIFAVDLGDRSVAAMYLSTERYGGCIAVNSSHPEGRQRVSVAHAYAHFLTDRNRPVICMVSKPGRLSKEERFAVAFASAFLIPASGVQRRFEAIRRAKKEHRVTPTDVLMLASLYRVPFQAMAQRLEDLKLLPSGTVDRLEKAGAMAETVGERVASETPRHTIRYATLVVQGFEEGLLTEGQFAERLGTDILGARPAVAELTEAYRPVQDGRRDRVPLDLSTDLLGAD